MKHILRFYALPVLFMGAMSVVLPSHTKASDEELDCERVRGRSLSSLIACPAGTPFEGQPLCTMGRIRGDLKGTFFFAVRDFAPSAGMPASASPDILSLVADGMITTKDGTLTLVDTGVADLNPDGDGALSDFMRIVDGTGEFAGATGTLFVHGGFNADKTGFRARWRGEICVADD